MIIVKPRVLEFRPGGVLKVILSGPQLMPPCIKMWLFHLFMLRRIKQPAWVYRAGRGWSGDAILDYRMSEAIQPHLLSVLLPKRTCALCAPPSAPAWQWFCDRTPFFCGPVTVFYHMFLLLLLYHPCPQFTPTQRGNRAEQQGVVQG